jgi:hypothetical protein
MGLTLAPELVTPWYLGAPVLDQTAMHNPRPDIDPLTSPKAWQANIDSSREFIQIIWGASPL